EAAAGVTHHVALSVVGTERPLGSGYFRAKMAPERLIKASKIPYTIVRATQFFDFVGGIAQLSTEGQTVRLPAALMQPIASDDVAASVADIAVGEPLNGMVEIAGPEPIRMDELVRRYLTATRDYPLDEFLCYRFKLFQDGGGFIKLCASRKVLQAAREIAGG